MNAQTYPHLTVGLCPACGETISLDKDVTDAFCQARLPECSPLGCLARYAQARFDEGRRMRAH